jgi:hypothetical protein
MEVIKIIKPFLEFLRSSDAQHAHNLMAIMLDLHFKALCIVKTWSNMGTQLG